MATEWHMHLLILLTSTVLAFYVLCFFVLAPWLKWDLKHTRRVAREFASFAAGTIASYEAIHQFELAYWPAFVLSFVVLLTVILINAQINRINRTIDEQNDERNHIKEMVQEARIQEENILITQQDIEKRMQVGWLTFYFMFLAPISAVLAYIST